MMAGLGKPGRFRGVGRIAAVAMTAVMALGFGSAAAGAGPDSSSQIIDNADRTVQAILSDTRIDFVPPLDGNALTREWFHSGRAGFTVSGNDAEQWTGHITLGYQVGYPATATGRIKFEYSTPGLGVEVGTDGPKLLMNQLIPQGGVELAVGFGPGIQTVEATGGDISGAGSFISVSGFHGTVSGVIGQTTIRPFVSVRSSSGDVVVTYGKTWTV